MIGGDGSLSMYVWHTSDTLSNHIFPEAWEVVDHPPVPLALLERFQDIGLPSSACYEIAMSAREGNVFLITKRTDINDNDNKRK